MRRFSFIKRFSVINHHDFIRLASNFETYFTLACGPTPTRAEVILYKELPHSHTTLGDDEEEAWREEDDRGRRLVVLDDIRKVTPELFARAVNIQVFLRQCHDDEHSQFACAHLECKGLLPDHMVFYVQPDRHAIITSEGMLDLSRPSRLTFKIGDGYEHNHTVSL